MKWTEEELNYLVENYHKMKFVEIAEVLGRTANAVHHKAHRLGLIRKGKERQPRYYVYDGYIVCSEFEDRYFIHRRVMEEYLGRLLTPEEIVHHIDGNKQNNKLSNLEVHTRASHMLLHEVTKERDMLGRFA